MLHYDARSTSHQAEVIAAPETWLKGQISEFSFLSGLQKMSLVAVARFLPGRAKDLAARYKEVGTCL
jgi:hypothetical protein